MTRDAERARNRARFPEFAGMVDSGRWKLVHAQDADGEVGKLPALPANCVEIDLFKAYEMAALGQPKGRK